MKCQECGYEWNGEGEKCPACGAKASGAGLGEENYRRGVAAEREGKKRTAARFYAVAADLGTPLAAWGVCRCLNRQENPDLYEFWLMTAARRDPIAADAYTAYLKRAGDDLGAHRMRHRAAELGSEGARLRLALYYWRRKNRPAARYYLNRIHGNPFASLLTLFLGRKPEYAPPMPEAPDDTVEMYTIGAYAEQLGLPHIAFSYYETAADASYLPAMERAADMCMRGQGVAQDPERVTTYLTKLGAAGNTDAYLRLADYYEAGVLDGTPNPAAAAELYRRAAEAGNARGMILFGDCLADGSGVDKNPEEALGWYDRSAKAGAAEGQTRADKLRTEAEADFRTASETLSEDPKGAVELFRRAAATGHPEALAALGDCLLMGRGCKKQNKEALDAYLAAAERGSARALYRLGCLYAMNYGVRYDYRLAKSCLSAAARGGIAEAEGKLNKLEAGRRKRLARKLYAASCTVYFRGKHAEAAKLRYAAAKLGNPKAIYLLGCMYDCGDGVPQDAARAATLYARALLLGFDGKANGFLGKYLRGLR